MGGIPEGGRDGGELAGAAAGAGGTESVAVAPSSIGKREKYSQSLGSSGFFLLSCSLGYPGMSS